MNKRHRVDYPRYHSLGLTIGSGEVEAQCKVLVQARCKQAGMRRSKKGAASRSSQSRFAAPYETEAPRPCGKTPDRP